MLLVAAVGMRLEPRRAARHVAEAAGHEVQPPVAVQVGDRDVGHAVQAADEDRRGGAFDAAVHQLQRADVRQPILGGPAGVEVADGTDVRPVVREYEIDRIDIGGGPLAGDLDLSVAAEHGQRVQRAVADVRLAGLRPDVHQRGHGARHAVVGVHDAEAGQLPVQRRLVLLRQRRLGSVLHVVAAQGFPIAIRERRVVRNGVLPHQDVASGQYRGSSNRRVAFEIVHVPHSEQETHVAERRAPALPGKDVGVRLQVTRGAVPRRELPSVLESTPAFGLLVALRGSQRRGAEREADAKRNRGERQRAKCPHGVTRQYRTFPRQTATRPPARAWGRPGRA